MVYFLGLKNLFELEDIIGESKGIQGHNNSCYLDATLFSMFTFAQCFDSLLYRPADAKKVNFYLKNALPKNNKPKIKIPNRRTFSITIKSVQFYVMKSSIRYENIILFVLIEY